MISKVKNTIELSYGSYWYVIDGKDYPIGNEAMDRYYGYEAEVSFIGNERIKLFVMVRMIKGDTFETAMNMVIDKIYLHDPDYRNTVCY